MGSGWFPPFAVFLAGTAESLRLPLPMLIVFGAAMVATSVGITARVLAGKGFLSHVASQTILAAAVIDDILGLLVLAVVSSMAAGRVNVLDLTLTMLLASAFAVLLSKAWNGWRRRARTSPSADPARTRRIE